jgi:purine-binding chemotaxis protein CheW
MAGPLIVQEQEDRVEEGRQHVTFSLNNEMYAIDAMHVQEIIELVNITKVPHLPEFLKGVINLRGTIIPVVDLKLKFGMTADGYKKHTCVIVTGFSGGVMGLIVDSVSDVLYIPDKSIASTPSFGTRINTDFIKGMARINDDLSIVLDVDKVLSEADVISLDEAKDSARPEGGSDV